MKILIITSFIALLSSCGSLKQKETAITPEKKDGFTNTTNTEFAITLPDNISQVTDFKKKKFSLGEKNNIFFEFATASGGNYWVTAKPIESELNKDAEVIININGDSPESLTLAKIDESTFHGIGFERSGIINIDLILKVPKQKTIVFNFDVTMENP